MPSPPARNRERGQGAGDAGRARRSRSAPAGSSRSLRFPSRRAGGKRERDSSPTPASRPSTTTRRRPGFRRSRRTPAWRWTRWMAVPGSAPPAGWDATPPTRRRTVALLEIAGREFRPGGGAPATGRRWRWPWAAASSSGPRGRWRERSRRPPRGSGGLWLRPGVPGAGIRQDDGGTEPRGEGAHQSPRPRAAAGGPFPEGGPRGPTHLYFPSFSGRGAVWQRACFGSRKPEVQILSPRQ